MLWLNNRIRTAPALRVAINYPQCTLAMIDNIYLHLDFYTIVLSPSGSQGGSQYKLRISVPTWLII